MNSVGAVLFNLIMSTGLGAAGYGVTTLLGGSSHLALVVAVTLFLAYWGVFVIIASDDMF
jgi:hypothetical protein